MDLQNLREHHEELLSFMENNGYSSTYIQRFRDEINRILADADSSRWQSYRDVYLEYLKVPHSKDYLRNKRTIIGALEQFDLFGRLPDGRHRHTLFERGSYHLLEPEFQELIDFYRMYEKQRGKKESTIRGESLNTASFLYQMQEQGAQCLAEVTEDAVLSFFVSEDGSLRKGCSYKKNISAVFKAGLNWKEPQCQRIRSFLPLLLSDAIPSFAPPAAINIALTVPPKCRLNCSTGPIAISFLRLTKNSVLFFFFLCRNFAILRQKIFISGLSNIYLLVR